MLLTTFHEEDVACHSHGCATFSGQHAAACCWPCRKQQDISCGAACATMSMGSKQAPFAWDDLTSHGPNGTPQKTWSEHSVAATSASKTSPCFPHFLCQGTCKILGEGILLSARVQHIGTRYAYTPTQ
eukprot:4476910-Amphidinium_carterae.2